MFKSVVKGIAFAGAMALATGAMADGFGRRSIKDAPYVAPFSWTGFYVGVNAGYAWGESDIGSSFGCPGPTCYFTNASMNFITAAGTGSVSSDGFTGGVQAGYNWQSGTLVLGVEFDFNALDYGVSRSVTGVTPGGSNFTASTGIAADWLFTARARLGMTLAPNLLAYVTGGLALADVEVSNAFQGAVPGDPLNIGSSASSSTKAGWTVGGGLEFALSRNWTLKGEYLYVDLGADGTTSTVNQVPVGAFSNSFFGTSADLSLHIARLGVNYKF